MSKRKLKFLLLISLIMHGCTPAIDTMKPSLKLPEQYAATTKDVVAIDWGAFFDDQTLISLIEMALRDNQELAIVTQELEFAQNEARALGGAYLPFVELGAAAGFDKAGRFTREGALEENIDIEPGRRAPEPLPDFLLGIRASWEIDIWNKLQNTEKAAIARFLASVEGRKFMQTNLIAEIARTYYELLTLDNQLRILQENIQVQSSALETIKLEKEGARVTELALKRFQAQLLNTKSLQYDIQQRVSEAERQLNFLVGRLPEHIERDPAQLDKPIPKQVKVGIPSELLKARPDIRQAELELGAADLDISVAKADFYPSLQITAGLGYQAYKLQKVLHSPESLIYSLAGDLTAPLINRRALEAELRNAGARQRQAVFNYEQTILSAFVEVSNQVSNILNIEQAYELKNQQVRALTQSIEIANLLFRSARADYTEVLLTQREALESEFELTELKLRRVHAVVNLYRALGGGWKEKEGPSLQHKYASPNS